jgi:hypothetical protein
MSNNHQFNSKIVISSGNFDLALRVFVAMKEDIERRYGKEAIIFAKCHTKPIQKDEHKFPYYYADFFLSIPEVG